MACTHTSQIHSCQAPAGPALTQSMPWLPYTVGTTTVATAATRAPSETGCPPSPSPSSLSLSAAGAGVNKETESGSSPSASSSSSSADAFSFVTSGQQSPSTPTSALCFGAGGTGRLWWSSTEALVPASKIHEEKEEDAQLAAASVAPRGNVVRRHLRMSRRLRKARTANKETPAAPRRDAVDDTARERGEAVASAIAHCKDTLRHGTPRRRRLPPPLSSLGLDLWLRDQQDEIIASTATHCDNDESAAAAATGRLTPSSPRISGPVASRQEGTRSSFSELEFLETFDGDDELIDRHFMTVQI